MQPQIATHAQPRYAASSRSRFIMNTYLHLFGYTAVDYMWARTAKVAVDKRDGDERAYYEAKLSTSRFYMQMLLPRTGGLFSILLSAGKSLMEFDDDMF